VTNADRHPDEVLQDAYAAELIAVVVVGADVHGRVRTFTSEHIDHAIALSRIAQHDLNATPRHPEQWEPVS
jgi:hypothetical protein